MKTEALPYPTHAFVPLLASDDRIRVGESEAAATPRCSIWFFGRLVWQVRSESSSPHERRKKMANKK